jgi:hypothetical protein
VRVADAVLGREIQVFPVASIASQNARVAATTRSPDRRKATEILRDSWRKER